MKRIFKIGNVAGVLTLAFIFGAMIGFASGINPTAIGTVATIGTLATIQLPQGVVNMGLSLAGVQIGDIVSDLNKYMAIESNQMNFYRQLRNGLELAPYMRSIGNQRGSYVGVGSTTSELLQAFQQGFTPKGTTSFVGFENKIFALKMDFTLTNIDSIVDSWLFFLSDETRSRAEWPLTRYIMEMEILPKLIEEQNTAMCRAEYAAPTTGTAGDMLESMDGLLTIVSNQITASALTPITTGSISGSNAVTKVETFADGIDTLVSNKGGVILCSQTIARYYKQHYRATYGLTNDQQAKNNLALDNYNIQLVPINGFGTSQRLVFVTPGNLIHLYDKLVSPSGFNVELNRRVVDIYSDWHCGIGFQSLQGVFVNDQA